jgi:hypothetical protein
LAVELFVFFSLSDLRCHQGLDFRHVTLELFKEKVEELEVFLQDVGELGIACILEESGRDLDVEEALFATLSQIVYDLSEVSVRRMLEDVRECSDSLVGEILVQVLSCFCIEKVVP